MKGLNNPAAIMAATELANTKAGQSTIKAATSAAKVIFIGAGVFTGLYFANKEFKRRRAIKYANDNIGNPNLTAAAIIANSFTRFEASGILGFLLPSVDISTDEAALNNIALQVTSIKAVADAYRILFDRTLFEDIRNGLDTAELVTFWNKINATGVNTDTTTQYPIGTRLYSVSKTSTIVNQAVQDANGNWVGNQQRYGAFNHNELVGEVIAYGIVDIPNDPLNGQTYYIIKKVFNLWFPSEGECATNCTTGVVVQSQVEPKP